VPRVEPEREQPQKPAEPGDGWQRKKLDHRHEAAGQNVKQRIH